MLLTVNVELAPDAIELGLNEAAAPAGSPLALSVTVCADPLTTAVPIVLVPLLPWTRVKLPGLALIEKSSVMGAVTLSEIEVEWVADVPVPVTVTVPAGVDDVVLIVRVELLPALTELGLNVAVAPAGSPLALSVTVCADPLTKAVPIVLVPLVPWTRLMLLGLALIEKSLETGALTVREIEVEWVADVLIPVTVTV